MSNERNGSCMVYITINGTDYRMKPLYFNASGKAYKLTNESNGNTYTVGRAAGKKFCDCPDSQNRTDGECKHAKALEAYHFI